MWFLVQPSAGESPPARAAFTQFTMRSGKLSNPSRLGSLPKCRPVRVTAGRTAGRGRVSTAGAGFARLPRPIVGELCYQRDAGHRCWLPLAPTAWRGIEPGCPKERSTRLPSTPLAEHLTSVTGWASSTPSCGAFRRCLRSRWQTRDRLGEFRAETAALCAPAARTDRTSGRQEAPSCCDANAR